MHERYLWRVIKTINSIQIYFIPFCIFKEIQSHNQGGLSATGANTGNNLSYEVLWQTENVNNKHSLGIYSVYMYKYIWLIWY